MAEERTFTGVEVELHELLDWSHDYEAFVDVLRDKIFDLDDEEYERVIVEEFQLMGVSRPNCAVFDVTVLVDDE